MSQHSVRQAARRSALDAQAVLRKERADRERRLEGWRSPLAENRALCRPVCRRTATRHGQQPGPARNRLWNRTSPDSSTARRG